MISMWVTSLANKKYNRITDLQWNTNWMQLVIPNHITCPALTLPMVFGNSIANWATELYQWCVSCSKSRMNSVKKFSKFNSEQEKYFSLCLAQASPMLHWHLSSTIRMCGTASTHQHVQRAGVIFYQVPLALLTGSCGGAGFQLHVVTHRVR